MRDHIPGTSARYILALSLNMAYSEMAKLTTGQQPLPTEFWWVCAEEVSVSIILRENLESHELTKALAVSARPKIC